MSTLQVLIHSLKRPSSFHIFLITSRTRNSRHQTSHLETSIPKGTMKYLAVASLLSALPFIHAISLPSRSYRPYPQPSAIPPGPYCPPKPASPAQQHAIFDDFINKLYIQKNATDAYLTYVSPDYINHSPYAPQGRAVAIAFLSNLIPSVEREILHETFDKNIGMVYLKVLSQPLLAIVDLFRLNGTCVMEHWDVNQALPANATNPIALF